jgi:hypothetical protein
MDSHRRRLVLAAVASMVVPGVGGAPAAGAIRTETLQVSDLTRRVLEVRLVRVGEHGPRRGEVGLLVTSRAKQSGQLRVRYTSAYSTLRFRVRGVARTAERRVSRGLNRGAGLVVPLRPHEVVDLGIVFLARAHATPEDLRGRLVMALERRGRPVAGAPLVLPVRGVRAEERLVTVSPKRVSLPVTLYRPQITEKPGIHRQDHGEAFVDLRGPGAAALAGRGGETDVVLRRDDGRSVVVPVQVKPGADNVARLVIPGAETSFEEPGEYKGVLPLGPGRSAPVMRLIVNVKIWFGWAVLAVLIGVLLGHMVPPLLKLERVRRRGRDAVTDALRRFGRARRGRAEPASYDLDSQITPLRWELRGIFSRPHDEPARLLREIKDGQTRAELEPTVAQAVALRERVDRWAQIETPARALRNLVEAPPPPRGRTRYFVETPVYEEAYAVLARLQMEPRLADPANPTAAELRKVGALSVLAEREAAVVELALDIWARHSRLDGDENGPRLPEPDENERDRWELEALWNGQSDVLKRNAAGFNALTVDLRRAISHLAELERKYLVSIVPPSNPWQWARTRLTRVRLQVRRVAAAAGGAALGLLAWLLGRIVALWRAFGSWLRGWLAAAELLSGLLKLAVPVLVYVLTLYGDTWGSPLDFLSAFAVGFAGKVGLDLGATGIKLRTSGGEQPPDQAGGGNGAAPEQPAPAPAPAQPVG